MNFLAALIYLVLVFLIYVLAYAHLSDALLDEDMSAEDNEGKNAAWMSIGFFLPLWGVYMTWGVLFDDGVLYFIRAIFGTAIVALIPFIIFLSGTFILGSKSGTFKETLKSYQVLIGLVAIALAIYFGRGF